MVRLSILVVLAVAVAAAGALWYDASHWKRATEQLHARLNDSGSVSKRYAASASPSRGG